MAPCVKMVNKVYITAAAVGGRVFGVPGGSPFLPASPPELPGEAGAIARDDASVVVVVRVERVCPEKKLGNETISNCGGLA